MTASILRGLQRRIAMLAGAAALACATLGSTSTLAQARPTKPDVRARFAANGSSIMEKGPDGFTAFLTAEINRWVPVIKASGAILA